jgi:hypothetical protein
MLHMQIHQLLGRHHPVIEIGHDHQRTHHHQQDVEHAKRERQNVTPDAGIETQRALRRGPPSSSDTIPFFELGIAAVRGPATSSIPP